jgi:predicted RNA-binding protein YlxR (DUF448 family)
VPDAIPGPPPEPAAGIRAAADGGQDASRGDAPREELSLGDVSGGDVPEDAVSEDDAPETGPQRRCLVTRERGDKERMIRFVVGPDRTLVPDLSARLPGRGMWLSARGDVVEAARTRALFARAARGAVTVPPDLLALLRVGLGRRIAEYLGLARRAGQAIAGFDKAGEWVRSGRAALVVQAADGSADERRRFLSGVDVPTVAPLPAAALGAVFGRDRAVHVAVAHGRLAATLRIEADRLAGLSGPADNEMGRGRAGRSGRRAADRAAPDAGGTRNDMRAGGRGAGNEDKRAGMARQAG